MFNSHYSSLQFPSKSHSYNHSISLFSTDKFSILLDENVWKNKHTVCSIQYDRHAFKTSYIKYSLLRHMWFIYKLSQVCLYQALTCFSLKIASPSSGLKKINVTVNGNKRPIKAAWRMTVVLRRQAEFPDYLERV